MRLYITKAQDVQEAQRLLGRLLNSSNSPAEVAFRDDRGGNGGIEVVVAMFDKGEPALAMGVPSDSKTYDFRRKQ